MRASRLIELLLLLQTRGGMPASELARLLEVSKRTVYRDAHALAEAGVPIWAERGPKGGIRLLDGYRTRLNGLSRDEAASLFLTGMPRIAAELGLATVAGAAQLKLLAALPAELREGAARASERFLLDAPGWFRSSSPPEHLPAIAGAVWDERRLEVVYRRGDGVTGRRFLKPLGLVLKAGVWYVAAANRGDRLAYRLDRLASVRVLDEGFERPADFDLEAFWAEFSDRFERTLYRLDVTLRVAPDVLDDVASYFGRRGQDALDSAGPPDEDGWRVLVLAFEKPEHVPSGVLGFGGRVEVLGPPEVRAIIVRIARELAGTYLTKDLVDARA